MDAKKIRREQGVCCYLEDCYLLRGIEDLGHYEFIIVGMFIKIIIMIQFAKIISCPKDRSFVHLK